MDNINSTLKITFSNLEKITAVNSNEDNKQLITSVNDALNLLNELNLNNLEGKDGYDVKVYALTLGYLKKLKEHIPSIIEKTIASRDGNSGLKTTVWNWITWTTSFSSEAKSNGIYENGSVDMKKLIENKDNLKLHDSLFTKELCDKLVNLYKNCINKMNEIKGFVLENKKRKIRKTEVKEKLKKETKRDFSVHTHDLIDKINNKQGPKPVINKDLDSQNTRFKEKLAKKKNAANKKEKEITPSWDVSEFNNILKEKLNIKDTVSSVSSQFKKHNIEVDVESIENRLRVIIYTKLNGKETFYKSDIDSIKEEIKKNFNCEKIYDSIKKDKHYNIVKAYFEDLSDWGKSKDEIADEKKKVEMHFYELIKNQVEYGKLIDDDILQEMIFEVLGSDDRIKKS